MMGTIQDFMYFHLCTGIAVEIIYTICAYIYHILKPHNSMIVHNVVIVDTVDPICSMTGGYYELEPASQQF